MNPGTEKEFSEVSTVDYFCNRLGTVIFTEQPSILMGTKGTLSKIHQRNIGASRFEPKVAGREARMLLLCCNLEEDFFIRFSRKIVSN